MNRHVFKPWEIPTRAKATPESVTAELDARVVFVARVRGSAEYQSPFDSGADLEDPKRRWWLHRRVLEDGSILYLEPMLQGNLSLAHAAGPEPWHDLDRYCYHDHDAAWRAVLGWNGKGDPEGWYRHPRSGRRRPDGDIDNEYINASER